jgi:hypothetical protein
MEKITRNFESQFKNLDELFINGEVRVPKILYLANKAEDGFEGDLISDFY